MFLKNKNIIFKIRRSKVADYAALILAILTRIREILACNKNTYLVTTMEESLLT